MPENKNIRIDKFLWAVRIFKTRSIASEECRKGRVILDDIQVKPSRTISKEEIITIRKPPVNYKYRVLEPIENRVSAKIVAQFIEDLTEDKEKAKLEFRHSSQMGIRDRGTGRPTKKERRLIDKLKGDHDF